MPNTSPHFVLVGLTSAAALSGCAASGNDDLTLGNRVALSTLSPTDRAVPPARSDAAKPKQSVTAVTRENWEPTAFVVPVDGTSHWTQYSVHPLYADETARQRGQFPTESSVLERTTSTGMAQQSLEAVASPVYSGLDIVMLIPRWCFSYPWSVQQSPRDWYQRSAKPLPTMERHDQDQEIPIEDLLAPAGSPLPPPSTPSSTTAPKSGAPR